MDVKTYGYRNTADFFQDFYCQFKNSDYLCALLEFCQVDSVSDSYVKSWIIMWLNKWNQ